MTSTRESRFVQETRSRMTRIGRAMFLHGDNVDRDSARRLGGLALAYSVTYLLAFGYGYLSHHASHPESARPPVFMLVVAAFCIALGFLDWILCRRRIFPTFFSVPALAATFEIAGALGIMASAWGWEGFAADQMRRTAGALGIDAAHYQSLFLAPLVEGNCRLLYFHGVAWIGPFILAFPMLIPSSPKRTLLVSLGAFATAPLVMFTSLAVHGVPPEIRPWVPAYIAECLVPVAICIFIAVYGSSVIHRLSRDLSEARRMGSYRLTRQIGVGGMGEVWAARHDMLARPAAIKVIRPEMLGPIDKREADRIIARFEREAQATAALNSPHTIQLYDFGRTPDGTFFYVMELLEGCDLRTLVSRQGPLPAGRTIDLLRQACHSLHDAHECGLTHRDIKPANIFTTLRGQDPDFVKVLDFGLVKSRGGGIVADETQLTSDGLTSGTPAFMAPEMVTGGGALDRRVDIYALGCVAWWLLVGSTVFADENPLNVIVKHVSETPPAPSTLTEIPVPPALDRVVLDCLAKKPDDRPRDALELSARLAECATAVDDWSRERALEWWENHPGGA